MLMLIKPQTARPSRPDQLCAIRLNGRSCGICKEVVRELEGICHESRQQRARIVFLTHGGCCPLGRVGWVGGSGGHRLLGVCVAGKLVRRRCMARPGDAASWHACHARVCAVHRCSRRRRWRRFRCRRRADSAKKRPALLPLTSPALALTLCTVSQT